MRKKINVTKDFQSRAKIAAGMDVKPAKTPETGIDKSLKDEPEKEKTGTATEKGASEETPQSAPSADTGGKKTTREATGDS